LTVPLPELSLSGLISPTSADTFGRDYWEKKSLLIQRDTPGYYKELLTLDGIDQFLSLSSLHESEVQVIIDGRKAAPYQLAADRPGGWGQALEVLYEHYRSGATITVMFLHQQWAPLAELCRSMSAELSATVQVNAYLTPAAAQGFNPHYDTHDVFIAQVYGAKRWRLYESAVKLPLDSRRFTVPPGGLGEPEHEIELRAGDLLYLPRGTVHEATSGETASLHLTIGATHPTWAGVLHTLIDKVSAADRRYRAALPIGFTRDAATARECTDRLAGLIAGLADNTADGTLIADAARIVTARKWPALRGHLLDLEALRKLDLDTPLRRRPDLHWTLNRENGVISLEFHGKAIRLPGALAAELEFAATGTEFTGRDIPGSLDEPGRLTLLTTLAREGFLSLSRT